MSDSYYHQFTLPGRFRGRRVRIRMQDTDDYTDPKSALDVLDAHVDIDRIMLGTPSSQMWSFFSDETLWPAVKRNVLNARDMGVVVTELHEDIAEIRICVGSAVSDTPQPIFFPECTLPGIEDERRDVHQLIELCIEIKNHTPSSRTAQCMRQLLLTPDKVTMADQPEGLLTVALRPYQRSSLQFMLDAERSGKSAWEASLVPIGKSTEGRQVYVDLASETVVCPRSGGVRGGVLSQARGTGKSVQIVALCLAERQKTLVVTTAPLVPRWLDQFASLAPRLRVGGVNSAMESGYDVIVMSWGCLSVFLEDDDTTAWPRVVLDESHDPKLAVHKIPVAERVWCLMPGVPMGPSSLALRALGMPDGMKYHVLCRLRNCMMYYPKAACTLPTPSVLSTEMYVEMDDTCQEAYNAACRTVRHRIPFMKKNIGDMKVLLNKHFQPALWGSSSSSGLGVGVPVPVGDDVCPICTEPYWCPVVTACGHWFCAGCLARAFEVSRKTSCPMCRGTCEVTALAPGVVAAEKNSSQQPMTKKMKKGGATHKAQALASLLRNLEPHSRVVVITQDPMGVDIAFTAAATDNAAVLRASMHALQMYRVFNWMEEEECPPSPRVLVSDMDTWLCATRGLHFSKVDKVIFWDACTKLTRDTCMGILRWFGSPMPEIQETMLVSMGTFEEDLAALQKIPTTAPTLHLILEKAAGALRPECIE